MLIFLSQQGGVLSLIDCTLIEEPDANDEDGKSSCLFIYYYYCLKIEPEQAFVNE